MPTATVMSLGFHRQVSAVPIFSRTGPLMNFKFWASLCDNSEHGSAPASGPPPVLELGGLLVLSELSLPDGVLVVVVVVVTGAGFG
nr:hypothetical protein [Solihabitans fulvus]